METYRLLDVCVFLVFGNSHSIGPFQSTLLLELLFELLLGIIQRCEFDGFDLAIFTNTSPSGMRPEFIPFLLVIDKNLEDIELCHAA